MNLFPFKKTKLLLPYNTETFCALLHKLKDSSDMDYKVRIRDNTFQIITPLTQLGKLNTRIWSDFQGTFCEEGSSTRVILQPKLLHPNHVFEYIISMLLVLVFLIVAISLFAILPFLISVGLFGIIYYIRYTTANLQINELKQFFASGGKEPSL